jgi:acylphosphatase
MSTKHFNIRVSGHVQGVFFRASTVSKARELNLAGFVRNETDGSVYIEVEGDDDTLRRFMEWTNVGPPGAYVRSSEITEGSLKNFSGFEIQR